MIFKKEDNSFDIRIVNQIRCLGLDIVNNAKSGHDGIILSAAPIIYTLFSKHLVCNPDDPKYFNRDRFIMSNGHGSALLYATLFMAGYNYTEEDLKDFRKINSITPGHPEYNLDYGIEMTTGMLGEGLAASVGFAIAEEYLRNYFKSKNCNLVDHYTYVLVGDGDLMEGVSYEAISLAGTLKLNKLIILHDNNNVSIDNNVSVTNNINLINYFNSCGFYTIEVDDSENIEEIDKAIEKAKESDKPTYISIKTTIGKHSKYENDRRIHGHILNDEDIIEIKNNLDIRDVPFNISSEIMNDFREQIINRNKSKYEEYLDFIKTIEDKDIIDFIEGNKRVALGEMSESLEENDEIRNYSYKVLNSINNPYFMSVGCDLFTSCKTYLYDKGDFSSKNRLGQNIYSGVREHLAGSIVNGLTLNNVTAFSSTFLTFSDYMVPAIRNAAIMDIPSVFLFTHDSIGIGEDGKTHQPIEQLDNLRNIPNVEVYRPADLNEVIGTFKTVFNKNKGVSIVSIAKTNVQSLTNTSVNDIEKGGYILKKENTKMSGILVSCGDDLHRTIKIDEQLKLLGYDFRIVSMPSLNRFYSMDMEYKKTIINQSKPIFVIESSSCSSYYKLFKIDGNLLGLTNFGMSGNSSDIYKEMSYDIDDLVKNIVSNL